MTKPFEQALRDELMAATSRRPKRRVGVAAAVAATIVAALVAASFVTESKPASADVEISHVDGRIVVRLTDLKNTAEEVEAATDSEGLDIRVEAVPGGPSQVGRFVGDVSTSGDVTDVERIEVSGVTFRAFSIPEDWDGTLIVFLGRTARANEPYQSSSDAFAPGEPLACRDRGGSLRSVVSLLDGYDVRVLVFENGRVLPQMSLPEAIASGYGDESMTGAAAVSSQRIVIDVGRPVPPLLAEPC